MAKRKMLIASIAILVLMSTLYTPRKVDAAASVATALPGIVEFLGIALGLNEGKKMLDTDYTTNDAMIDLFRTYAKSQVNEIGDWIVSGYDAVGNEITVAGDALKAMLTFRSQAYDAGSVLNEDISFIHSPNWALDGFYINSVGYVSRDNYAYSINSNQQIVFYKGFGIVYDTNLPDVAIGDIVAVDASTMFANYMSDKGAYRVIGHSGLINKDQILFIPKSEMEKKLAHRARVVTAAEGNMMIDYTDAAFKEALPDKIRIPALEDFKPMSKATGKELEYRPTTNDYVIKGTGTIVPPTDVFWDYPIPKVGADVTGAPTITWDDSTGATHTWDGSGTGTGTGDMTWIGKLIDAIGKALARWFVPTAINTAQLTNVWVSRFPAIDGIMTSLGSLATVSGSGQCPVWPITIGTNQYEFINLCKIDQQWISLAKTFAKIILWSTFVFMVLREFRPKPTIG